jgi:carboxyl-terminal processing protease
MQKTNKALPHAICVALALAAPTLLSACGQGEFTLTPLSPPDYLNKAITTIQRRALRSPKVDWKSVKSKAFEMIAGAKSTTDTYAAINYVLSELGDNHSFLRNRAGQGTKLFKERVQEPKHKRVACSRILEQEGHKYGFVVVPSLGGSSESNQGKNFARQLQQQISEAAEQKPAGWIVDVRGNGGGNMWPMIVGVGPLIGTGTLGYFVYKNANIAWYYEGGQSGVINARGKTANFKLENSIADLPNMPVVVLIDGATASSGEALTISFKGRASTCFIGDHTYGVPTNNEGIKLPDGATLLLTTSGEADRNHVSYDDGISPDVKVDQGDVPFGAKDDPGIKAAIAWLSSQ